MTTLTLLVATRLDNFDFTATGHAVVLTVGMLLSTRFHSPARWSPPALDAAAAGVAFGDTALVGVLRGRSGYRTRHSADRALRMFSGEQRGSSCERDRRSVMAPNGSSLRRFTIGAPSTWRFRATSRTCPCSEPRHRRARRPVIPESLAAASDAVLAALKNAGQACVLPGLLLRRLGLQGAAAAFVDASGLPFATMFADKSVLGEDHPGYIGMYVGRLMDEPVRAFVESCDVVVMLGAMLTDGNTAGHHRPAGPG